MGTRTGVGTCRRAPDGNGDGKGDGSEDCSGDGNGDDDDENENRIGEGGREAKKRKKPQNSCENPTWIISKATRKQGGEHKVLRAQVRFVRVERVCPLCRV